MRFNKNLNINILYRLTYLLCMYLLPCMVCKNTTNMLLGNASWSTIKKHFVISFRLKFICFQPYIEFNWFRVLVMQTGK